MIVIHYGASEYNPELFQPIVNSGWIKPVGGLWTSPINSKFGWKSWCTSERFRVCDNSISFKLKINKESKIYKINSLDDLLNLPLISAMYGHSMVINFEELAKEYDSIWLTVNGQNKTRMTYPTSLYGWDCETVLIMNKNSFIII